MSTWKSYRLGELFDLKHGYAFKGDFFSNEGKLVLLTPGNFHEHGGLKLKGEKEKYYSGEVPGEYLLRRGDLLIAMTDLMQEAPILGSPAFIPEDGRYLHNQRLGKVVNLNEDAITPNFLFYLLNTPKVRSQIKATATGATVRHTAPSRVAAVLVNLPSIPIQNYITGILSAYDDLIENSQRRIKILESMARGLYREWFVHFRFPGHEGHPRVASPLGEIPQGWTCCALGDFVSFKTGFSFKSGTFSQDGNHRLVTIRNVQDGVFDPEPGTRIGTLPTNLPGHCILKDGDILLSLTGNIGRTCLVYGGSYLLNQRVAKVVPLDATDAAMAYCLFRQDDTRSSLERISNGVAQQNLSPILAASLPFACPPKDLRRLFSNMAAPMIDSLVHLSSTIQNLRKTRDLLLPRLLSGQIDLDEAEP